LLHLLATSVFKHKSPLLAEVHCLLSRSKPSILIIDDDIGILRSFRRIFQARGFDVSVAQTGKQAIEQINVNRFDVALIDLCLPDMEGTELFPLIQGDTLKIMISGKPLEDIYGADLFIGKPIQPDKLLSIIVSKLKDKDMEH
jgi:DNA-binding NtrC family response regulator